MSYQHIRDTYQAAGQGHVLTFYDELPPAQQTSLLEQLADIDVERVNRIYDTAINAPEEGKDTDEVKPLPDEACATILNNEAEEAKWRQIGLDAIKDGKVAVLLLAGGQGTRLGSSLPKGMFDLKLPSGRTLFEYQARRIAKLEEISGGAIRWYIMTSGPTRQETQRFFEKNEYFGLKNVVIFEQGEFPEAKLLVCG